MGKVSMCCFEFPSVRVHCFLLSLTVLLFACGGGSNGSNSDEPEAPEGYLTSEACEEFLEGAELPADVEVNTDDGECVINQSSSRFNFFSPINLSETTGHSYRPKIAFDNDNMMHVVWHDNSEEEKGIEVWYVQVDPQGLVKNEKKNISNSPAIAVGPQIEIDGDNVIHVVWQDNIGGVSDIYHAKSTDGGDSFSTPINVSNIDESSMMPDLSVDPDGNIYVVWSGPQDIYVSVSTDGGETFNDEPTAFPISLSVEPTLDTKRPGEIHIVWAQFINAENLYAVEYVKSTDIGETFTPRKRLASSEEIQARPNIGTRGDGVYVAWDEEVNGVAELMFTASIDNGESFSSVLNISNNAGVSIMPTVEVAHNGDVYIAWQDTTPTNYETVFSYSTDQGQSFSEMLNFAPSPEGSLVVDMSINSSNQTAIVWDDNRFGSFESVLSFGGIGIPALYELNPEHEEFNPDNEEFAEFKAIFTEVLRWQLDIRDENNKVIFSDRGIGTLLDTAWDGNDVNGDRVEDGLYRYELSGETRDNGKTAIGRNGTILLSTAEETDASPEITAFETDQIIFSPNDDGRGEEALISAIFNVTVDWELTIVNEDNIELYRADGSGFSTQYLWSGLDESGEALPEGIYTVKIEGEHSSGVVLDDSLDIAIDLTPVFVTEPVIGTVDLSEDQSAEIAFSIDEGAVVTVYIYEEGGLALVNELFRNAYDDAEDIVVEWDGTAGGGAKVNPGEYLLNIWARDYGANRHSEYPIRRAIIVEE